MFTQKTCAHQGAFSINPYILLSLKILQARHEECGLLIPNERRATPPGGFSASTRTAGPYFSPSGVIVRSYSVNTLCSQYLAGREMGASRIYGLIWDTP